MRITAPAGAKSPFGGQSMQEVCDRLGPTASKNSFLLGTHCDIVKQGVFVTTTHSKSHKAHIRLMEKKMYPVADKRGPISLMHHLVFERSIRSNNDVKWLPRAGTIIGSRENLCNFVEYLTLPSKSKLITGFDILKNGMYWEMWHPQKIYPHPYLDIDIPNVPQNVDFDEIYTHVHRSAQAATSKFKSLCDEQDVPVVVFYNKRPMGDNGHKYSFHLHWPTLVAPSISALGAMVHVINNSVPKKPVWSGDGVSIESSEGINDTKPYGNNSQLFRLPFTGKFGDNTSKLIPICPEQKYSGERGRMTWGFTEQTLNVSDWINKSCTFTTMKDDFTELVIDSIERPILQRREPLPANNVIRARDDDKDMRNSWLNFWTPVLFRFVLPHFVMFRQSQMSTFRVHALTPDPSHIERSIDVLERLVGYLSSYRISLHGDNFCEYDDGHTPYRHKGEDNAISYVVDLSKGKIAQQCQKCRPRHLKWRTFIQEGRLSFHILEGKKSDREASDSVTVNSKSEDVIPFFLSYNIDRILFCKEKKKVMVYNNQSGIWQSASDGNRLLLELVEDMNEAYKEYQRARHSKIADEQFEQWQTANPEADDDKREEAEEKINKECRKQNLKIKNILSLTASQQKDFITALKAYNHPHQRERMETHTHLIPLKDCKCVDVFSWSLQDIKSNFYFTSHLNATLIDLRDDSIQQFTEWQKQVCCGDTEYMTYKFRIFGLSFTMLNFDRAFYMPLGPIGKNGKSSEATLFNEITMSVSPNRGYNLSREYLTKSSQDRKSANSPDTVLIEMSDKCVVIADECRDVPLDGPLIKSFVSGDKANARNLYESERSTIESHFTLWIIGNKSLLIDYTDNALMSRTRFLPYNAQWVPDVAEVKSKLPLPQSLYVFQEDPFFKERVLKNWGDAMVTKCLYELHIFMAALQPRDQNDPTRPAKLVSIPIPSAVQKCTTAQIQKEHPVLAFIQNHLGQTDQRSDYVSVEQVFSQFRLFGRNDNNFKMSRMNKTQFIESLQKQFIELCTDDNNTSYLDGYYLKKEIQQPERDLVEGFSYQPPPLKRLREDDQFI